MNQSLPEQKYCFVLREICSHVCFGWKELFVCWVYDLKFMLEKIVQIFDPCHFQLCQFWPWKGLKRLVGHRRFQIGTVEGALQGCQLNKWKRIECRANLSIRALQRPLYILYILYFIFYLIFIYILYFYYISYISFIFVKIFAPIQGCGRRCPTRPDCSTAEAAPSLPKTPKPTTTTKKDLQQENPKNIR